ncbi:hypothetical protein F4678DRAFT_443736 [Xylaria arbuscula]|nr:hypothetical protein F4678DRAFT_443736 [Xylaria arbuscula]
MDDTTLNSRGEFAPRSGRKKRPHQHDDDDDATNEGRSVRRRDDDYGHGARTRGRRSRSPHQSHYSDRRDSCTRASDASHMRHRQGDTRNDRRRETAHRDKAGRRSPRSRSASPARHHRHRAAKASRPDHRHHQPSPELPFDARPLSRSTDFTAFQPLFARYLDVQKQIDIARLDEREIRGRWKSFVGKWNNAELAEGWYRAETFEDTVLDARGTSDKPVGERRRRGSSATREVDLRPEAKAEEDDDDDGDDYGPTLPTQEDSESDNKNATHLPKPGPGIPTLEDLTQRRELETADRDDARALLRHERKLDRTQQKERLDELAPRADAGTAARRLEKKREARDSNAAFASAAKGSGEMPDLADAELMGGDEGGGVEEYKRLKREAERKKTEREVRREEIWRAKREEREERVREYRAREASTVDMLREIAKSRFG